MTRGSPLGPIRRQPIRLRLTLVYSSLFLLAGVVLLAVTYGLVDKSLSTSLPAASSVAGAAYKAQAVKICESSALDPVQAAKCKAQAQQSLTKVTQTSAAFQRTQTLRRLLDYSLGALVVAGVMSAWLGWIVAGRVLRHNVPNGWVQVATGTREGMAFIEVANGGALVPEELVPSLFEPFRRLSECGGSPEGAGLGLSIVRSVVVAHHGQLTARHRPAGGLEVSVLLPGHVE